MQLLVMISCDRSSVLNCLEVILPKNTVSIWKIRFDLSFKKNFSFVSIKFAFADKRFSCCFPGQTIRQAYHMILDKQNEFVTKCPHIVVNVGAIDILLDRNLIDIQTDYARLVKAILTIGCRPILTTIPDLLISPNNPNKKIVRQTLLLFNRFVVDLHDDGHPLIDFHSYLLDSDYHP